MTNMEIFNNAEFGRVRVIEEDGNYLFCAKDVAEALGYAVPRKAIYDHCRYVLKRNVPHPQSETKTVQMLFISEGDVYRLIVHSKLPSAERFERWVFDEVLPALRKNGIYITDPMVRKIAENPEYINSLWDTLYEQGDKIKLQSQAIEVRDAIISTQGELIDVQDNIMNDQERIIYMQRVWLEEKDEIIGNMSWKAEYYDKHMEAGDGVPIRVLAKQLEISEKYLVSMLIGCRFLYRCGGHLLPYADRRCAGMFKVRESETLVTPKGKGKIFKVVEALRFEQEAAV